MSNNQEPYDNDSGWYRARCNENCLPIYYEKEQDFLERVAIKCANGIDEDDARSQAFNGD